MVDTLVLGASAARHGGSSPLSRTIYPDILSSRYSFLCLGEVGAPSWLRFLKRVL